ncbi:beta-glucosidase [Spirosomataceae bacterium TFI 002]|nr:beta-glucosidase [Spirosomataceae bacterium TFI 002]
MKHFYRYILSLCLIGFVPNLIAQEVYKNNNVPIADRVNDLLSRMTLEEKVGQLNQLNGGVMTGPAAANDEGAQGRLQLLKQGKVGSFLNVTGVEQTLAVQKIAVEESRLGIPVLFAFDVIHGYKTVFPIPLAEACSWDLEIAEQTAAVAAKEAAAAGLHWTFAPMMDMSRDPRWGRVMEGSGEDAYINGVFAAARVKGFQGDFSNDNVLACVKHFAAYGAPEGGREYNTVDISRNSLWNNYIIPYKHAVDAGVATVMNSFNVLDGIPASGNKYLVTEVLRDKWGFEGIVVSDWASFGEMIAHGFAKDGKDAAEKALMAGSDIDMESRVTINNLAQSIKNGDVPESLLDKAVARVLYYKFKLGLFENPYARHDKEKEKNNTMTSSHLDLARKAAAGSMLLLKNDDKVLPLSKNLKNILVLGFLAESQNDVLDFWKGMGDHGDVVTILEGVKAKYPNATVNFLPVYDRDNNLDPSAAKQIKKIAKNADVILGTIGLYGDLMGEARVLADISPAPAQMEMLRLAKETGKPVVVLVQTGRPMVLTEVAKEHGTILNVWSGGIQHGNGVADVLSGDVNPSAKTVMSFPHSVGQIPVYYNTFSTGRPHVDGNEGPAHFWVSRYRDIPNGALFPFGYGLSYSTYDYSNISLSASEMNQNGIIQVSVEVKNTSSIDGEEIVQLYIRDLVASRVRPIKELKGFKKVKIKAGETQKVSFTLSSSDLSFKDDEGNDMLEKGTFKVFVGKSSQDVLEASFELK